MTCLSEIEAINIWLKIYRVKKGTKVIIDSNPWTCGAGVCRRLKEGWGMEYYTNVVGEQSIVVGTHFYEEDYLLISWTREKLEGTTSGSLVVPFQCLKVIK